MQGPIRGHDLQIVVNQQDAQGRRLEHQTPSFLARAQRRFRTLANPDVSQNSAQLIDRAESGAVRATLVDRIKLENRQHLVAENDREAESARKAGCSGGRESGKVAE